jgi:hypothetical protein
VRGARGLIADMLAPTVPDPLDRGGSGLSRRVAGQAGPHARQPPLNGGGRPRQ